MTERYFDESEITVTQGPSTNRALEVYGANNEATRQINYLELTWEDESSEAWLEIFIDEDGNIEVEGRDPVRMFAGSPDGEFTYSNEDSHIEELEKGKRISRKDEILATEGRSSLTDDKKQKVVIDGDYKLGEVEELPDADLKSLYELTDIIRDGATKEEIDPQYLESLFTKVQRASVAWESDSGEEPSEYR